MSRNYCTGCGVGWYENVEFTTKAKCNFCGKELPIGRVEPLDADKMLDKAEALHEATKHLPVTGEPTRDDMARAICDEPADRIAQAACLWNEDEDGHWFTACDNAFDFFDGGPKDNRFGYCPYCGRHVIFQHYSKWEVLDDEPDS